MEYDFWNIRELYSQLHILAHQQLIRDHRMSWETAYFRYGRGSARIRAYDIDAIYRDTAPLPDEIDQHESDAFLMQAMEQIQQTIQSEGGKLL